MSLWQQLLERTGWSVKLNTPLPPKCLICVVPHTSNWDFVMGEVAIRAVGMKAGFLMKSAWFFWPLGYLMRALGGIPVKRLKRKTELEQRLEETPLAKEIEKTHLAHEIDQLQGGNSHVTEVVIDAFKTHETLAIAITPEGTRSANPHWHKGLLVISQAAQVPIVLAYIDYQHRVACIDRVFTTTGQLEADMQALKDYYRDKAFMARYPEKFSV